MKSNAKYVFRMDDICPSMKWSSFTTLMGIFEKHQVVPLLGIVPENKDPHLKVENDNPKFWEIMKNLMAMGQIEVAQHGTYHEYISSSKGILAEDFGFPSRSEFAGLPYEIQLKRLSAGKKALEQHEIFTTYFMAPSHSFDVNTLRALKTLGFVAVTDGVSKFPYRNHDLVFVPQMHWSPRKIKRGIQTICIHSNEISQKQIEKIATFLDRHDKNVIKFSEALGYCKPYSALFAQYWKIKYQFLDKTLFPTLTKIRNAIFWNEKNFV